MATMQSMDDAITSPQGAFVEGRQITLPPNELVPAGFETGFQFTITMWHRGDWMFSIFEKTNDNDKQFEIHSRGDGVQLLLYDGAQYTDVYCSNYYYYYYDEWRFDAISIDFSEIIPQIKQLDMYNSPGCYSYGLFNYTDDPSIPTYIGRYSWGYIYEFKFYDQILTWYDINSEFWFYSYQSCFCIQLCTNAPDPQCSNCWNPTFTEDCSTPCACEGASCINNDPSACAGCHPTCKHNSCLGLSYTDCAFGQDCHRSCSICSGLTNHDCIACADAHAELIAGECRCVLGFAPTVDSVCIQCSPACESCAGESDSDCESCFEHASLQGQSPSNCVCDAGFFPSHSVSACTACDDTCAECVSPGATGCTACKEPLVLSSAAPAECVCAVGFYMQDSVCLPCSAGCGSCEDGSQCRVCVSNAIFVGTACECLKGFVKSEQACLPCRSHCEECNTEKCLSCRNGLISYGQDCVGSCPDGFKAADGNSCEEESSVPPVAILTVASDNSLVLNFDKEMSFAITVADVSIEAQDQNSRSVELSWADPDLRDSTTLVISLRFSALWLPEGCTVTLIFLDISQITDTFGVTLKTASHTSVLFPFGTEPPPATGALLQSPSAQAAAAASKGGMAAGAAASLFNGSPAGLISMINQLQLITYLAMTEIPLPVNFASTLAALNAGSMLPNPLAHVSLDTEEYQTPPQHVRDYGIGSSLLVTNAATIIGTYIAILASYLPIFLMTKVRNTVVSSYFKEMLGSFRWGIPIQLWLTSYLDLSIFCLLQISNPNGVVTSVSIAVNYTAGCVGIIALVASPVLICVFTAKKVRNPAVADSPGFKRRWGKLYSQFKPNNRGFPYIFIPLFLARRLILAFSLVFVATIPVFILVSSIIIGLTVNLTQELIYLLTVRPFSVYMDNIEAVLVEGSPVIIYFIVLCSVLGISTEENGLLDTTGVWAVRVVMAGNVALSIVKTGKSVVEVVRVYIRTAKVAVSKGV